MPRKKSIAASKSFQMCPYTQDVPRCSYSPWKTCYAAISHSISRLPNPFLFLDARTPLLHPTTSSNPPRSRLNPYFHVKHILKLSCATPSSMPSAIVINLRSSSRNFLPSSVSFSGLFLACSDAAQMLAKMSPVSAPTFLYSSSIFWSASCLAHSPNAPKTLSGPRSTSARYACRASRRVWPGGGLAGRSFWG
jgi:hypothetical protein